MYGYNKLSGHVTALTGLLTNLHTLDIEDNNLGEHVTALASLINLHTLDIVKNNLGKHVTAFKSLTNLVEINKIIRCREYNSDPPHNGFSNTTFVT
jgi:Leucine-rich repeat (LRR) protein